MNSFYGNITNIARSVFQFDKIYASEEEMRNNERKDNVYYGRFVLVDKDASNHHSAWMKDYVTPVDSADPVEQYVKVADLDAIAFTLVSRKVPSNWPYGQIMAAENGNYYIDTPVPAQCEKINVNTFLDKISKTQTYQEITDIPTEDVVIHTSLQGEYDESVQPDVDVDYDHYTVDINIPEVAQVISLIYDFLYGTTREDTEPDNIGEKGLNSLAGEIREFVEKFNIDALVAASGAGSILTIQQDETTGENKLGTSFIDNNSITLSQSIDASVPTMTAHHRWNVIQDGKMLRLSDLSIGSGLASFTNKTSTVNRFIGPKNLSSLNAAFTGSFDNLYLKISGSDGSEQWENISHLNPNNYVMIFSAENCETSTITFTAQCYLQDKTSCVGRAIQLTPINIVDFPICSGPIFLQDGEELVGLETTFNSDFVSIKETGLSQTFFNNAARVVTQAEVSEVLSSNGVNLLTTAKKQPLSDSTNTHLYGCIVPKDYVPEGKMPILEFIGCNDSIQQLKAVLVSGTAENGLVYNSKPIDYYMLVYSPVYISDSENAKIILKMVEVN